MKGLFDIKTYDTLKDKLSDEAKWIYSIFNEKIPQAEKYYNISVFKDHFLWVQIMEV